MSQDLYAEVDAMERDDEGFSLMEYDITATPNDFNIITLYSLIDNGVIIMPPFQRNYVWDIKRASKLIESIILGLPVPQVFLYEKGKNNFYVIDGQQRLLSIYFFMKQRFPTEEGRAILRGYLTGDTKIDGTILSEDKYFTNFNLKLPSPVIGEKNKLNKLKYETLGDYKHTFEIMRTVRSVVIKQNEPDDNSSIHEIFNRLNTGGQNLYPQEIRMSLYYSDFYRSIIDLNQDTRWRNILKQETPDIHFRDVEILIRIFAMLVNYGRYSSPMSKFLNAFSKEAESFSKEKIEYLRALFISFLDNTSHIKPENFAVKSGQFRISLFEAIFVAACHNAFNNNELVNQKITIASIDAIRSDQQLIDATQGSVASKISVDTRIKRAEELIKFQVEQ